jgi:catechol 2,3-dioxygenase-like lactoylglutathione lyase family enzyme
MEAIIGKMLEEFEQGKLTRRQLIQSLALGLSAASATDAAQAPTTAKPHVSEVMTVDHISYQVADYTKSRDFYTGLLGMSLYRDDSKRQECRMTFGDTMLIARNAPSGTPRVDHIAYAIADWKNVRPAVNAEVKRLGLWIKDTDNNLHVKDPDGFEIQMGAPGTGR